MKQMMHQPKNKQETLILVSKIKDENIQEIMMVIHQLKNKLKTLSLLIKVLCKNQVLRLKMQAKIEVKINPLLLKLKSLLKMIKANIPVKTGTQMIKWYLLALMGTPKPVVKQEWLDL